jgi:hypothetical protein
MAEQAHPPALPGERSINHDIVSRSSPVVIVTCRDRHDVVIVADLTSAVPAPPRVVIRLG